jgi:sacsin
MENAEFQDGIQIQNFGPHEKLTDRIKGLLGGYKDGISIFKELIQNADDAKATVIKFCYDKRENQDLRNSNKLFDPEMAKLQGPSLLVFNDGVFTDNDFENLCKLGGATKLNEKDKIGKFGLGFCSVYNITDVPCILSCNTFVAFDPNIKYLRKYIKGSSNPGIRIDLSMSDVGEKFDQFKPYDDIFDCKIFNKPFHFDGTLMRLPLRNEPSEITSHLYNKVSEMSSLFEILYENSRSLLLFTQNIKRVEFYMLEENQNCNMSLLFKFEKSPVVNLNRRCLKANLESEYKEQSSILTLAVNRKNDQKIHSSFIIKNKIVINRANAELLFKRDQIKITKEVEEKFWLVVCSFDPDYLVKNDENFSNFLPCVGMAIELEPLLLDGNGYTIKKVEGSAFCFLPLSIATNLNFHVNGPFSLSEDRLKFYENSKYDKINNKKHEWNKYLLEPLIENLFLMIKLATEYVKVDNIDHLVETFWPLNNNSPYFQMFEEDFYQKLCNGNSENFPYLNEENLIRFCSLENCLFVDFYFEDNSIQKNALGILDTIVKNEKKQNLIYLPKNFLLKIKHVSRKEIKFIDDYELLELVIKNKHTIDFDKFERLISYYLSKKFSSKDDSLTRYALLIKTSDCIPTSNNNFKCANDLINPCADKSYLEMFEETDDMFPSKLLCSDKIIMKNLNQIGLLNEDLTRKILLDQINKVSSLDLKLAKKLSNNLLDYLGRYFKRNKCKANELASLRSTLSEIEWVFSKTIPNDWFLPWFVEKDNERKLYKPSCLFCDNYKFEVGCIKPTFDSRFENVLLSQHLTLEILVQQIKYLINFYQNAANQQRKIPLHETKNLEKVFKMFYQYVTYNLFDKALNSTQKNQYLTEVKQALPNNWILIASKENCSFFETKTEFMISFCNVNSFAFDVNNPTLPDLNKFSNHEYLQLFKVLGVAEHFSLENLKNKLIALKTKFGESPLDEMSQKYCHKLILEMIYVDQKKLSQTQLVNLPASPNGRNFFLPDENWILREIKDLCSSYESESLTDNSNQALFVLERSVPAKCFGVKSAKQKIFGEFRIPFGQKKDLVLEINRILSRYSSDLSVFHELIQNADDSGATEIKFILDFRQTHTKSPYKRLLGPALCSWNNSTFKETDFAGIISLGMGSKQNDLSKCGKFGLGFNSVYHITDCPQFISNLTDYVVFDPLCECFPDLELSEPGCRIPNGKIKLNMFREIFDSFNIGLELKNSTMFRFPLRSAASKLSSNFFDKNGILSLLDLYSDASKNVLFFLKNIKKISFHTIEKDNRINCFNQETTEIGEIEQAIKINFMNELKFQLWKETNILKIPVKQISYCVNIDGTTSTKAEYLIIEQVGWSHDIQLDYDQSEKKFFKMFPFASIAFNLDDIFVKNLETDYKIYNFLPINQDSPLKCHLNGHWCLREDNRSELYEFDEKIFNMNSKKDKFDKNAKDWNLKVIEYILCPIFVELFKLIKEKIIEHFKHNDGNSTLILKNYMNLFPKELKENNSNKLYFSGMLAKFYGEMFNLECFPIKIEETIHWCKPSDFVLIDDLQAKSTEKINTDKVIQISTNLGIRVVHESFKAVLNLFEKFASLKFKQLNSKTIVSALKSNSLKFDGVEIKKTAFKDIECYKFILKLCLNDKIDLDECPLLLTNALTLKKFSKSNKLFKFKHPEIFAGKQDYFLHKDFDSIIKEDIVQKYLKLISIKDLAELMPMTSLGQNKWNMSTDHYFECDSSDRELVSLIWQIIMSDMKEEVLSNKSLLLEKIKPIENWPLIPIKNQNLELQRTEAKNYLMPISKRNLIINYEPMGMSDFIFNIVNKINLPTLDMKFLNLDSKKNPIESIVMTLNKTEDILTFLNVNKTNEIIFKSNEKDKIHDAEELRVIFNETIKPVPSQFGGISFEFQKNDDSLEKKQIKASIKELRIFTDLFGRVETIDTKGVDDVFILNLSDPNLPSEVLDIFKLNSQVSEDFLDFSNKADLFLMEKDERFKNLYKYLDIREISMDQLYVLFFKYWCSNLTSDIPQIFSSNVNILRLMDCKSPIKNVELVNILKNLAFIKASDSSDYTCASQFYDDQIEVLSVLAESNILPEEYRKREWKKFLIKLGMKETCDSKDCIQIASILNKKYTEKEIDIWTSEKYAKLLFKEMEKFKKPNFELLDGIKDIRFIPNFYFFRKESVHSRIFSPLTNRENELVCLKNSTLLSNEDYSWIIKPILPDYCTSLLESMKPISYEVLKMNNIKLDLVLENLKEMVKTIQSKHEILQNLNENDTVELFTIFKNTFLKIQNIDASNESVNELNGIHCVLNRNLTTNQLQLSPISTIFKTIDNRLKISEITNECPYELAECWDFFEKLGAKAKINFDKCLDFLEYYCKASNASLAENQFENVIKIYRFMLIENYFDQNDLKERIVYAPNMNKQMKPLNLMYYADTLTCEELLKESEQLKNDCIFDIKLLSIESTNSNSFSKLILNFFSWEKIFQSLKYFRSFANSAARPLSEILVERNLFEDGTTEVVDSFRTEKLHSSKFINSIVESIFILDEHLDKTDIESKLKNVVRQTVMNMFVYEKDEIITCFFNTKLNEKIDKSEKKSFLACCKSDGKLKFFQQKNLKDEYNLVEFYQASSIVAEIQKKIPLISCKQELSEIIKNKSNFLHYLIQKLIQEDESNYGRILNDFKSKTLFTI